MSLNRAYGEQCGPFCHKWTNFAIKILNTTLQNTIISSYLDINVIHFNLAQSGYFSATHACLGMAIIDNKPYQYWDQSLPSRYTNTFGSVSFYHQGRGALSTARTLCHLLILLCSQTYIGHGMCAITRCFI